MSSSLVSSIRRILLPPESRQELFLRTLYHRLNATPFFIRRQMRKAAASYREFREQQTQLNNITATDPGTVPGTVPGVIFLLEIASGSELAAIATIRSLQAMVNPNWHLVPVPEAGVDWDAIASVIKTENRIINPVSIGDVSPALVKKFGDEFVVFCRAGDIFSPMILNEFAHAIESTPLADVVYTDSEYRNHKSGEVAPFFKPSAASPELMLSVNYLSRSFIRATHLLESSSGLSGLMSMEYDLLLRLIEGNNVLYHIPRVLINFEELPVVSDEPLPRVLKSHFERQGAELVVVQGSGGYTRVNWNFGTPSVSLIILSRNHGAWLRNLVNSILTLTDYQNYSLIIVDNHSTEPEVLAYYNELVGNDRVALVHYDQPFNYSEAINIGVAHSTADVVVLLNNDMLVTDAGWLRELVQWAMLPGIGVVGGKLLHRDRTIQHAGIILGMNGFIGHLYLNAPEHYHGLAGSVDWYRDIYAVTGACQAVRRDLFHQVGKYDERFRLAFGDIDFCLRVDKAGFRNLYNPFARLTHFEGGSRGYETPVKDILLAYDELLPWLEKDDPYFSPNLTYQPIPLCNLSHAGVDERLQNIENRRRSLLSD